MNTSHMSTERRAAVLLARMRAEGAMARDAVSAAVLAAAEQAAARVGRQIVDCPAPVAPGRTAPTGRSRSALVLGWANGLAPSPEDGPEYPVRRLSTTQALTWAACLGMAWPERSAAPYPGEPFREEDVVDLLADLGVPSVWVKAALKHDLPLARLVVHDGKRIWLGPAAAALPDVTVEALRRFHDRLPRRTRADGPPHRVAIRESPPTARAAEQISGEEASEW